MMRLLLLSILAITLGFFARYPVLNQIGARTPDEYYYHLLARPLAEQGFVAGTRINMELYHREGWRWKNPPTSRIGFIGLVALAQEYAGLDQELAGAWVSLIASLISSLAVVCVGYLIGGTSLAICALIISAMSPLTLALAVRAWTDGLMECLGAIALLGALLMARGRFWCGAFFSFISAFFIIWVKESGYVVTALFVLPALRLDQGFAVSLRERAKVLAVPICGTVLGFVVLSLILGGFNQIPLVFDHLRVAVPQADYARNYQDGPWYDFLLMWFHLAPISLALLFISSGLFLFFRKSNFKIGEYLTLWGVVLLFMIPPCVFLYYKNIRYLSPLFPIFFVLMGVPLAELIRTLWSRTLQFKVGALLALSLLAAGMAVDYTRSKEIIVVAQCQDLNLRMLKECRGLQ